MALLVLREVGDYYLRYFLHSTRVLSERKKQDSIMSPGGWRPRPDTFSWEFSHFRGFGFGFGFKFRIELELDFGSRLMSVNRSDELYRGAQATGVEP